MKTTMFLATLISVVGTLAFSQNPQSPGSAAAGEAKRDSPFACDRLALTPELRKRHFDELGPTLRTLVKAAHELATGYEFAFPADPGTFKLVAEWAAGEHACCPFFDIDLHLERENGAFWLRLSGRDGVKQFIRSDFAKWFKG